MRERAKERGREQRRGREQIRERAKEKGKSKGESKGGSKGERKRGHLSRCQKFETERDGLSEGSKKSNKRESQEKG